MPPRIDGSEARRLCVLPSGAMGHKEGLEGVVDATRMANKQMANIRFGLLGNGSQRDYLQRSAEGIGFVQFVDSLDDVD